MTGLDYGKYAIFIWPAVAVTAAVLAWMVTDSLLRARYWHKKVQALEAERAQPGAKPAP
jgi:heme exporter protein D